MDRRSTGAGGYLDGGCQAGTTHPATTFMRGSLSPLTLASPSFADPLLSEFTGAQVIVRIHAEAIFPNCPRYIHKMQLIEQSAYAPRADHTPPVPAWKQRPEFREVLPPGDRASDTSGQ